MFSFVGKMSKMVTYISIDLHCFREEYLEMGLITLVIIGYSMRGKH